MTKLRQPQLCITLAYAAFQPKNFVDELVLAKWRKLHIVPSADADDAEFLRRVFLDAMGTLPTPQEVRDFVADSAPDKRDTLIDRVLEREEYFDLWAHRVGDLLRNRVGDSNAKDNTIAFAKWIRQSLVENKPYDQFVREIITVTGKRSDHPQMDWYRWAITNENRVEDTAQAFLGLRVSCANCHNHPFEKVSQTDYWQFAAFFARVKSVTYGSVLDAISSATGVPQKFEDYPEVKKAILLPNEKARSDFLEIFGRSERTTPCECETSLAPNLSQVLYLLNSKEFLFNH